MQFQSSFAAGSRHFYLEYFLFPKKHQFAVVPYFEIHMLIRKCWHFKRKKLDKRSKPNIFAN
jgi:hypothetical protein